MSYVVFRLNTVTLLFNICILYCVSEKKLFCLTGVRELFEQEPPPPPRKTRAELMKDIDADYYGYRDDDDGILTPLEQNEERRGDNAVHSYSQALPT
jgi:hypothetical protein